MKKLFRNAAKIGAVIAAVGIAAACSDYLDQPINGNLSEDEFYITEADAQNGLIAVYDTYSVAYNAVWPSMYLVREIIADDVNAGGSDGNDQAGFQQMDDFTHDSQNDQILGSWKNLWRAAYRATKAINKTAPDTPAKAQMVAEAKVLRGFIYLDLVTMWGGVPILLDDVPASAYQSTPRASREEVLDFIISSVGEAIADLPTRTQLTAGNKFRVSKGTAQALVGKAQLYKGDFAAAATSFESVINSGEYALQNDVMANFDKKHKFDKESLFEINYGGDNGGNFAWGSTTDDNIIIQLMGVRGDYYVAAPGDSLIGGWGFDPPRQELYDAYVDAGDDGRRMKFMMSEQELKDNGGDWTNSTLHDYEGLIRRKYGTFANQSGFPNQEPTSKEFNYGTDFVLLRYADVLLMAAEANNKKAAPDDAKALGYVNQVRTRPSTDLAPLVGLTGATLFNAIVAERRLELAFEGHRFADLVRWGLADEELGDLGFVAGKHEVLPIPNVDVIAGKFEQNANY